MPYWITATNPRPPITAKLMTAANFCLLPLIMLAIAPAPIQPPRAIGNAPAAKPVPLESAFGKALTSTILAV